MKQGERERDLFSLLYVFFCDLFFFLSKKTNTSSQKSSHPFSHSSKKKERSDKEARKNERRW